VQLFGDSTMRGYDGDASTGVRAAVYPALALQAAFDAQFGAGQVTVIDRAVDGMTSQNLIDGTDGLNLPWPGSVTADLVVVNFGINDRFANMPTATYKANLRRLSAAAARVVLQTPLPVWASYYPTRPDTSYAPEMREVATELGLAVADVSAYALGRADWRSSFAPLTVHPNSAGYQTLATEVLAPIVLPIAANLRCTP
jgi:lysophospholipase L1-like esterase